MIKSEKIEFSILIDCMSHVYTHTVSQQPVMHVCIVFPQKYDIILF